MNPAAGKYHGREILETLSDYWRKTASNREGLELANLLKSLRRIVGHLGTNAGTVEYAGMSYGKGSQILIDQGSIMGQYPVPAQKVDILVGLVIHEALHNREWSGHVWKTLEPEFGIMSTKALIGFQKVVSAGEDIYVDSTLEGSMFGMYLAEAQGRAAEDMAECIDFTRPSIDALVALWWMTASRIDPPRSCWLHEYRACRHVLSALGSNLKEVFREDGIVNRCKKRAGLFLGAWRELAGKVEGLAVLDRKLLWYAESLSTSQEGREDSPPNPVDKRRFTADLAHEIEHHLAAGTKDITPLIRAVVGSGHEEIIPTSRWDFPIPAGPMIDHALVKRLKSIFLSYSKHEFLYSRGLTGGKVDGRRLYRAPVSGRCFKQREVRAHLKWDIVLLIDASGSMRGTKWKIVENTAASLHRALSGCGGRFGVYAYFESDGICMISSLVREGGLHSIIPAGRTASGQAIIAAALVMPSSAARKLLIHITDGESNAGCDVRYGIEYCGKCSIPLVTLGCACRDRQVMREQYGSSIEFLEDFRHLPVAVENLLRRLFLYGHARAGGASAIPLRYEMQKKEVSSR